MISLGFWQLCVGFHTFHFLRTPYMNTTSMCVFSLQFPFQLLPCPALLPQLMTTSYLILVYAFIRACIHTCIGTHIHVHTYIHVCMHTYMRIYMHVYTHSLPTTFAGLMSWNLSLFGSSSLKKMDSSPPTCHQLPLALHLGVGLPPCTLLT